MALGTVAEELDDAHCLLSGYVEQIRWVLERMGGEGALAEVGLLENVLDLVEAQADRIGEMISPVRLLVTGCAPVELAAVTA